MPTSVSSPLPLAPASSRPDRAEDQRAASRSERTAFASALRHAEHARPTERASAPTLVRASRTPLSGQQARSALASAWQAQFGSPPSTPTLSILTAQWAHETGRGESMLNYNFGGIKGTGPSGLSTAYNTREGSGANEVRIRDQFRAYESAEEGAGDYVSLLARRYPEAVAAAHNENPEAFVRALKQRGYFTGDETAYVKSVTVLANQALSSGFDSIGSAAGVTLPDNAARSPSDQRIATHYAPHHFQTAPSLPHLSLPDNPTVSSHWGSELLTDEISRTHLLISALELGRSDDSRNTRG